MKRACSAAFVSLIALTSLGVGTGSSLAASSPVPIAKGLANPRQIAFSPSGGLFVALAGSGRYHAKHPGGCATDPEGGIACAGDTGGIERVVSPGSASAGAGRRVQFGLFSIADKGGPGDPAGSAAVGLDAVSFAPNGTEWGIITAAPPSALKGLPSSVKNGVGHLVRISSGGTVHPVVNVANFSLKHPTNGHSPDTDPYGVLAFNDRVYVADAAADTLLEWTAKGGLRIIHAFPHRNGDGSDGSFDTVPTSIATDGKHLFVGTLASFIPGQAKVYELTMGGKVVKTYAGFSQVTSTAVDEHGNIYVTEIFGGQEAPFDSAGKPNGLVVEAHTNGKRTSKRVPLPGGIAARNGHLYVSVFSITRDQGAVWRLR
jgi:hypothetical protein